jgi:hypothetical protein
MLTRNASSERIVEGLAFRRPLLLPGAQSQERLWGGGSGKTSQGLPDTVSACSSTSWRSSFNITSRAADHDM